MFSVSCVSLGRFAQRFFHPTKEKERSFSVTAGGPIPSFFVGYPRIGGAYMRPSVYHGCLCWSHGLHLHSTLKGGPVTPQLVRHKGWELKSLESSLHSVPSRAISLRPLFSWGPLISHEQKWPSYLLGTVPSLPCIIQPRCSGFGKAARLWTVCSDDECSMR